MLCIKCNPFLSHHGAIPRFYIGRQAVVQITRLVPLVRRICDIIVRVIEIVFLASVQLVFPFNELSNVLFQAQTIVRERIDHEPN